MTSWARSDWMRTVGSKNLFTPCAKDTMIVPARNNVQPTRETHQGSGNHWRKHEQCEVDRHRDETHERATPIDQLVSPVFVDGAAHGSLALPSNTLRIRRKSVRMIFMVVW